MEIAGFSWKYDLFPLACHGSQICASSGTSRYYCKAGPDAVLSIEDIAAHLPTQTPNLDALSRILRYLSSIGIFTESIDANTGLGEYTSSDIRYGLTHLGKSCFVIENNPLNLAPYFLLNTHEVVTSAWNHFDDCVLEGRNAFKKRHGKDFWAFAESNGDFNQLFNTSMVAVTSVLIRDILNAYDGFKDVNILIDLGGGVGQALRDLISARSISICLTLSQPPHHFQVYSITCYTCGTTTRAMTYSVAEEVDVSPQADPIESGRAVDMVMLGLMSGGGRERGIALIVYDEKCLIKFSIGAFLLMSG
eukprot:Gb_35313 [translate_table: standard]